MSIRLQVVMDESELSDLRQIAQRQGLTLAAWVRQVLRRAGREEPTGDSERKRAAVRTAARHGYPAPDIEQMLAEIEGGYVRDRS